jgi:[protein-PII] uridylyltransferase
VPRTYGRPKAPKPNKPLICETEAIFNEDGFLAALDEARKTSEPAEVRTQMVTWLREAQKTGRAKIANAFLAKPFDARPMTRGYTYLTDHLVCAALHIATTVLHPNPTSSERLSVIAVGGYGRGEMAPASDVDLLFLTPYKVTTWAESVIESMFYMLWDHFTRRWKIGDTARRYYTHGPHQARAQCW